MKLTMTALGRAAVFLVSLAAGATLCAQEKGDADAKEILRLIRSKPKTGEDREAKRAAIRKARDLKELDVDLIEALLDNLNFDSVQLAGEAYPAEITLKPREKIVVPYLLKKIAEATEEKRRLIYASNLLQIVGEAATGKLKEAIARSQNNTEKERLDQTLRAVEEVLREFHAPRIPNGLPGSKLSLEDAVKGSDLIVVAKREIEGLGIDVIQRERTGGVDWFYVNKFEVKKVMKGKAEGELVLSFLEGEGEATPEHAKEYIYFVDTKPKNEKQPFAIKILRATAENLAGVEKALKALEEKK